MISCDTNILFPACDSTSPNHENAHAFLVEYSECENFCLCEQVLMELYCLLRNPVVCKRPLSPREAVSVIQGFRSNPKWSIVDVVNGSNIMKQVWKHATRRNFAYRRIFDVRLALTLQHNGVNKFATRNKRDFASLDFELIWDPFTEDI